MTILANPNFQFFNSLADDPRTASMFSHGVGKSVSRPGLGSGLDYSTPLFREAEGGAENFFPKKKED